MNPDEISSHTRIQRGQSHEDEVCHFAITHPSRTGAHVEVGGEDIVEVVGDRHFLVFEIFQPSAVRAGGVGYGAADFAQTHGDAVVLRQNVAVIAGEQTESMSHDSSLKGSDQISR